ncbi:hypothetical protein UPYG_G00249890 [Umbra pygmaea]|uniref:Uncharacterized protein n=1 Tax=Umbra pygmaea TaxID=75934 RepID=A0ABD0WU84_UMBPY
MHKNTILLDSIGPPLLVAQSLRNTEESPSLFLNAHYYFNSAEQVWLDRGCKVAGSEVKDWRSDPVQAFLAKGTLVDISSPSWPGAPLSPCVLRPFAHCSVAAPPLKHLSLH